MNRISKILFLLAAFVIIICGNSGFSVSATTEKPGIYNKESAIWFYGSEDTVLQNEGSLRLSNLRGGDRVTIKSSNNNICSIENSQFEQENVTWNSEGKTSLPIQVYINGTGRVTFTCKVKRGSKTFNSKKTVRVIEYVNPFKTIKIGDKEYTSLFEDRDDPRNFYAISKKRQISIQMKDGYVLKGISGRKPFNIKTKKFKNNSEIDLNKYKDIYIYYQNKKIGEKNLVVSLSF